MPGRAPGLPPRITADMTIRLLRAADAAAFQRLRLEGLREAPASFAGSPEDEQDTPLAEVARRLEAPAGAGVLGAFDGEALVGIVGLARDTRAKLAHKGHVWGMYVHPRARGRGLGRELMQAAIAQARAMPGVERLTLVADTTNAPAIALYESLGFVAYGREPDAVRIAGVPHEDLLMSLPLATA